MKFLANSLAILVHGMVRNLLPNETITMSCSGAVTSNAVRPDIMPGCRPSRVIGDLLHDPLSHLIGVVRFSKIQPWACNK